MQDTLFKIFFFILGACWGSFLNVLIYRLPRDISIVKPGSFCPHCRNNIKWYDNIPILSYLLLKGKCRYCKKPISFRYFLVEILSAVLFLFLYSKLGFSVRFFVMLIFSSLLIIATFTDIEHRIIPDQINLGGLFLGILFSGFFPYLHNKPTMISSLISCGIGILLGGGLLYISGLIGKIIFRKEAMGGGDVKFLAMVGAFWGPKLVLFSFFTAPFLGAIFGLIWKIKTKKSEIPYGPFLAITSFLGVFYSEKVFRYLFGF